MRTRSAAFSRTRGARVYVQVHHRGGRLMRLSAGDTLARSAASCRSDVRPPRFIHSAAHASYQPSCAPRSHGAEPPPPHTPPALPQRWWQHHHHAYRLACLCPRKCPLRWMMVHAHPGLAANDEPSAPRVTHAYSCMEWSHTQTLIRRLSAEPNNRCGGGEGREASSGEGGAAGRSAARRCAHGTRVTRIATRGAYCPPHPLPSPHAPPLPPRPRHGCLPSPHTSRRESRRR